MKKVLSKLRERFSIPTGEEYSEGDYIEIDPTKDIGKRAKIIIKPFVIDDFSDIKPALDALREGYNIVLLNIKPLKDKDIVELKRAVNKLKKTCDAIGGDLAGFAEDWIVATPNFAYVHRNKEVEEVED